LVCHPDQVPVATVVGAPKTRAFLDHAARSLATLDVIRR